MRVYTIKDIENFEKDEYGRTICPSGDYTRIDSFGEGCIFGEECRFGERCGFGEGCIFGKGCRFGEWCIFGEICSFGERCRFGEMCIFGEGCRFGNRCTFGEWCNLENNLKFENIEDAVDRVLKIDRIGSRRGCTYFFKTLSEIYVRCSCFFGTISEFENQVNETHKDNPQHLLEYTEAIKYAKTVLGFKKLS